jgi:hypothetical protein
LIETEWILEDEMADKGKNKSVPEGKANKKKGLSPEQRSRRIQQVLFGALAIIMVFTMIVSLIVH